MVPFILSGGGVTCDHCELVKWVRGDLDEGGWASTCLWNTECQCHQLEDKAFLKSMLGASVRRWWHLCL